MQDLKNAITTKNTVIDDFDFKDHLYDICFYISKQGKTVFEKYPKLYTIPDYNTLEAKTYMDKCFNEKVNSL